MFEVYAKAEMFTPPGFCCKTRPVGLLIRSIFAGKIARIYTWPDN